MDYSVLSAETKAFIDEIESQTSVPVTIISTGPDLKDTIDLRKDYYSFSQFLINYGLFLFLFFN